MLSLWKKLLTGVVLLTVLLSGSGCAYVKDFDSRLRSIAQPYAFSIAGWELKAAVNGVKLWFNGSTAEGDSRTVIEYFSLSQKVHALESELAKATEGQPLLASTDASEAIKALTKPAALQNEIEQARERQDALREAVQKVITRQIRDTLSELGIHNPAVPDLKLNFPPINFNLEKPPHLLVVSPRDHIESLKEITLRQDITPEEMEAIEADANQLNVSSLVVELGGFGGTYPTFVVDNASLKFTLDAAVEEWLHQYLAFKPLGFRYVLDVLGISKNYDIRSMNETLAGIVSKEIASRVFSKYYAQALTGDRQMDRSGFDFNKEMREIRKTVDGMLAQGQIQQAETFMEQKRQYLASKGYNVRKLNQAYFAFHGSYGDSPAYISPIGAAMRKLRTQSASLKDFLENVASMTGSRDLFEAVK